MTFWATLYYAGAVVLSMGYEGQTLEQCNQIGEQMIADITSVYNDPAMESELAESVFPTDEFSFTCETEQMTPDEKYAQ